jgi:CheY-like chemotaxis protein
MSGTILLADDSLTIQKVVELTFADTDYRVVAVSSGDDLLTRLSDTSPDLIICDVIMPGRDGYDVCQELKSNPIWLHLPVILLTGTFEPFDRDRAIAAGCSEIITKPFEARKLVETVERLIGPAGPAGAHEGESVGASSDVMFDTGAPEGVESAPGERHSATAEEFGTQLAAPPDDGEEDGIEFTASGFAEMEAAGRASAEPGGRDPEDGLEYDFGGGATEDTEESSPSDGLPMPPEDPSAQTIKIELPSSAGEGSDGTAGSVDEAIDEAAVAAVEAESLAAAVIETAPPEVPEVSVEPFAELTEEPFDASTQEGSGDEDDGEFHEDPALIDTSPVAAPAFEVAPAIETQSAAVGLSGEDIDRIAVRVLELASERIEQIAWEVIPDMAEIVVRRRIRELEAETEGVSPDAVQ